MGKNVMTTEERLVNLGLKLPPPPEAFGMYRSGYRQHFVLRRDGLGAPE